MQAIEVSLPQLILLDVSMHGMDGFEFCEVLKKEEWIKEIPVIVAPSVQFRTTEQPLWGCHDLVAPSIQFCITKQPF